MSPIWLHEVSFACLAVGIVCAILIAIDRINHPQRMWIMNIVWPVNGLFGTVLTLLLYYRFGRLAARDASELNKRSSVKKETPFSVMIAKGAMHCGAGCTLGDIVAESLVLAFPAIAIWAGWKTLFSEKMFAIWWWTICSHSYSGWHFSTSRSSPCATCRRVRVSFRLLKQTRSRSRLGKSGCTQLAIFRRGLGVRLERSMPAFWS